MIPAILRRSLRALPGAWTREGEWLVARWPVRRGWGQAFELETAFQVDDETPAGSPPVEAALAALLLPAMRRGRHRILLPGSFDSTTEANLPRLQAMFEEFFYEFELERASIRTPDISTEPAPASAGTRVGVFSSMGVDSFFSLLSHLDETDDLILVRGFDIGLEPENDGLWNEAMEAGRAVAGELGKRLVPVRTNVRLFLEKRGCPWGISHGAALAHVSLALQPWLHTVYLPSSFDLDHIAPWGSHPHADPLWSASRLEIVHDGAESCRLEKIQRIAESPLVDRFLRVCNLHPGGIYNCGRCDKCLPTMLALDTAGALFRSATFPPEIKVDDFRAVATWGVGGRLFLAELREWWRKNVPDHQFLPVVEEILERPAPDIGRARWG